MKTKKNNNKYFSSLNNFSYKFIVIFSAFLIIFGTLNTNRAFAYFSDEATIDGNTFTAGTLEINIDTEDAIDFGLMYPGDNDSTSIGISNTGTLDSQYIFKTIPTDSDNGACDYITVSATDSINTYTGTISNFTSVAENTTDKTWNFDLKVNDNAPASVWGKTCSFKWEYTAWQTDLHDSSLGFTSVKEKIGEIEIGKAVVMNEILPNPEGLDTQLGLQGEWVELYNNSNISIELSGWKIKDEVDHEIIISPSNTMNGRTRIEAEGSYLEWVVVFMSNDIMNNTGDTISFYDNVGTLVDQYTYTSNVTDADSDSNSTGGADNNNPTGSETAGNEGKSYARIPDGTGAWIDPIPTPGEPNVEGELELPEENDSPVLQGQTIETLVEEITGSPILEAPEEIKTEESADDAEENPATEEETNPTETAAMVEETTTEVVTETTEGVTSTETKEVVTEEPAVVEPTIETTEEVTE